MKLNLTEAQIGALKAFLERFEDAESISMKETIVDLYDHNPPMTIDLMFEKNGVVVDGAARLMYDEEMDGWYIGERIEDADAVLRALTEAGAFGK